MISLKDKDIISILDFTKEEILYILEISARMEREACPDILKGKILANLFFEPSNKTQSKKLSSSQTKRRRKNEKHFMGTKH